MITCKVGENIINCYDGIHNKEQLKKWADKNILICPVCGKPYEYCHGEFVSPYFRHKDKIQCEDRYSEPESQEHINGKRDLYEWIKNQDGVTDALLEGWLPETKQRPDIMFKYNGKQYVIEYQCTPIASEYIERHELYQAGGIKDIWVLGTDKYLEKSEIGKKFRKKELEYHTSYYYDSNFKLFILKDGLNIGIEENEILNTNTIEYFNSSDKYFDNESRKFLSLELFVKVNDVYMINIDCLTYENDSIKISKQGKNLISERCVIRSEEQRIQEIKDSKCNNFVKSIISEFNEKYNLDMNTMQCSFGFKCRKHYYKLHNIENFPMLNFCEIKYVMDKPIHNTIFTINIETDTIDSILDYIKIELLQYINEQKKFDKFFDDAKKKYEKDLNNVTNKLKQFTTKPIYLLFTDDDKEIPKHIRFKLISDYYEDEFKFRKNLLDNLTFLHNKNAKNYTFMIPRKKLRTSTSFMYPYYKVCNYRQDVMNDFKKLGFNVLGYDDLIKEDN